MLYKILKILVFRIRRIFRIQTKGVSFQRNLEYICVIYYGASTHLHNYHTRVAASSTISRKIPNQTQQLHFLTLLSCLYKRLSLLTQQQNGSSDGCGVVASSHHSGSYTTKILSVAHLALTQ